MLKKKDLFSVIYCGFWGLVSFFLFFSAPLPGSFFFAFSGIFFIGLAACFIAILLRDRTRMKKAEFSGIVGKCRYHPDKDIEDMVREAVQGARHWTFKKVWKKLRDSHDYGTVFTGPMR